MLTKKIHAAMLPAVGTFGQYIRLKRLEAGLSQRDLARAAGLTKGAISLIERGERTDCRADTVRRIAAVLNLDATEVFARLDQPSHLGTPSPRMLAPAG